MSSSRPRRGSCTCAEGGEGLDFLGFHHRWVRGDTPRSRHLTLPRPLALTRRRCSTPATAIREITARERLLLPVEEVVQDLNRFLRGWAGYFRYGNSARHFDKITHHAVNRLALFVGQAPQTRARGYGWRVVAYQSPDRLGLISLNGTRRRAPTQPAVARGR